MKLEAKSRLLLTAGPRRLVSTPVKLILSDGTDREFHSGQELDHWLLTGEKGLTTQKSFPVGHYLVVLFSNNKVGVAKAYQSLWVDTEGPKPGTSAFDFSVANSRSQIKQAMDALKRSHHPEMKHVKADADAVLAFYDTHMPEPDYTVDFSKLPLGKKVEGRRTQGWFHKLSAEEQEEYCKKFPGTRFRHNRRLVAP